MSLLTSSRVLLGSVTAWRESKRLFSYSLVRRKAIENWKRPSIEEIGVPKESWQNVFAKNQKKYTVQLLAGVGLFGVTVMYAYNTVFTNSTPAFVRETGFVTIMPKPDELVSGAEESLPVEEALLPVEEEALPVEEEALPKEETLPKEGLEVASSPAETIVVVEEAVEEVIKVVEEVVEVVKETLDVVKETIEKVDETVEEVK